MNKIKFIILMFLVIVLYQGVCLVNNYLFYLHMFLVVAVWLLGTKDIKKDTIPKKIIIYGFGLLWCGIVYIMIEYLKINSKFSAYFSVANDFWAYSVLPIFVISKISSINTVKEKIENEDAKFLIILSIIIFIVGYLITNHIYHMIIQFEYNNDFYNTQYIYNHLNIVIFIIQLLGVLKIKVDNKSFVLISTIITVTIVLIINIIPIIKVNNASEILREYDEVINSDSLTYKNIVKELEPYKNNEEINNIIFDYQFYEWSKDLSIDAGIEGIEKVNRVNFNKYLDTLKALSYNIEEVILPLDNSICNNRIAIIIISTILIIGICVSLNKEDIFLQY